MWQSIMRVVVGLIGVCLYFFYRYKNQKLQQTLEAPALAQAKQRKENLKHAEENPIAEHRHTIDFNDARLRQLIERERAIDADLYGSTNPQSADHQE